MSIDIASNSTKDKLLELIEEISSVIAKLPEDVKDYPEARKLLLAAYRKLMGALETTSESFFRLYWQVSSPCSVSISRTTQIYEKPSDIFEIASCQCCLKNRH